MQYNFIATGRSVDSLKFDELGSLDFETEQELEEAANAVARELKIRNKRRKVVSVFRPDEDVSCYTVVWDGFANFSRNYEAAANSKRGF